MFSLIYAWINGWVNNSEVGDLRRHHAHWDVIVMANEEVGFAIWSKQMLTREGPNRMTNFLVDFV